MAISINGFITGKLGDKIYYIKNGKNYSRPVRKVTTPPTEKQKAVREVFTQCGRIAKALKTQIGETITQQEDGQMYIRILSDVASFLKKYCEGVIPKGNCKDRFSYCRFTNKSARGADTHLPVSFSFEEPGTVIVTTDSFIPSRYIKAPSSLEYLNCRMVAAGAGIESGLPTGSASHIFRIDNDWKEFPEQRRELHVPPAEGSLIVLAMSVEYVFNGYKPKEGLISQYYSPSGIVNAWVL